MRSAVALKRKQGKVYDSPEELALVHSAKRGNEAAFSKLYANHYNRVRIRINRMLHDEDQSEWLANFVLAKVWDNLRGYTLKDGKRVRTAGFREQSKFSTWVIRIAINDTLMYIRSEKRRRVVEGVSLDAILDANAPATASGKIAPPMENQKFLAVRDLQLEGSADRQMLEEAIGRVPVKYRKILRLQLWEGRSLEEIRLLVSAAPPNMGVSLPALKTRLLRGRLILKEQVTQLS